MKTTSLFFLVVAVSLAPLHMLKAQDSTRKAVKKQINSTSEDADKRNGRKIQQQQLTNGRFEKLDTGHPVKTVSRQQAVHKRKKGRV